MNLSSRILIAGVFLLASCTGQPTDPGATLASIRVSASTTGVEVDPDGYGLRLDDLAAVPVPVGGLVLSALAPGSHRLELVGLAANCSADRNPRAVTAEASRQLEVAFAVVCRTTKGTLAVLVATQGFGADPSGYAISVDGGLDRRLRLYDSLIVTGLEPGAHTVTFGGERPVCEVSPRSPMAVVVVANYRVELSISVTCHGEVGGTVLIEDSTGISETSPDGTSRVPLSRVPGDSWGRWSPDGSKIVFVSLRDGNGELYLMDSDGSNQVRLTNTSENETGPVWSPDGTEIAFSYFSGGGNHVALINADGTDRRTITEGTNPSWAPDGSKIAFSRTRKTGCFLGYCQSDLRTVKVDGTKDTLLVSGAAQVSWSPDGRRIAFRRLGDLFTGPGGLRVMSLKDRTTFPIGNGQDGGWPVWARTGTFLAFTSGADNELMIVELQQPDQPRSDGIRHVRATSWKD